MQKTPDLKLSTHPLSHLADLLLLAGRLLMENGAPAQKTREILRKISRQMGCPCVQVAVAYDHIVVDLIQDDYQISRVQGLSDLGVNFQIVFAISQLCRRLDRQTLSIAALKDELDQIARLSFSCPKYSIPFLAGIGCACVGQIFGADLAGAWIDFCAASCGCFALFWCWRPSISPYFATFIAATVSGIVVHLMDRLMLTQHFMLTLSASVLYVVPGLPMISGLMDILMGQISTGLARLVNMIFLSAAIALGLLLSMAIEHL